ncbi:MAG: hypothetical protein Q4P06_07885 [Actinomycetaceae bacterium]|nr:hypothetical protein [Actinomycetaceae bacterium]
MLTLSITAFILGSFFWTIGDILIVGFDRPDNNGPHREFIEFMGSDNYAYQLTGSEPRLRAGALVANFSTPLLLAGIPAHWMLAQDSTLAQIGVILFSLSICFAPLAHATFYFLAQSSKLAYAAFEDGALGASRERVHAQQVFSFLKWAWFPAVACMLAGGVLLTIAVALGYTPLPAWAALLSPPVVTIAVSALTRLPYPGRPLLNGAAFNLAAMVWGITFFSLVSKYPLT